MSAGHRGEGNRVGYLWLELVGTDDGGNAEYLTLGAFIRFSRSTAEAKVWYFTTPRRVAVDLQLMDAQRIPLSRDKLAEAIGADRITESPEAHRDRVRTTVFGLSGESGRDRFRGLMQLLHVLRNPDVGNRIDAGGLPTILSDALPPLTETAVDAAGKQLDALTETREAQKRLKDASDQVATFLSSYRRYATGVVLDRVDAARSDARAARAAAAEVRRAEKRHAELVGKQQQVQLGRGRLEAEESELTAKIAGIRASREFHAARELTDRERQVSALARAATTSLRAASDARSREAVAVAEAATRADEACSVSRRAASALAAARADLGTAGVAAPLPEAVTAAVHAGQGHQEPVRTQLDGELGMVARPLPPQLAVTPADPAAEAEHARAVRRAAAERGSHAETRLASARELARTEEKVVRADERTGEAESRAEELAGQAADAADARDAAAGELATAWQRWVTAPTTVAVLGPVGWQDTAAGALLADPGALAGPVDDDADLEELDRAAQDAAAPARQRLAEQQAALAAEQAAADAQRQVLAAEQAALRAARDPEPATAPWQTGAPEGAVPLWRAVDFTADTDEQARAGLEAALHAAGLLTASLHPDGNLVAAAGQVLVRADGPIAACPLTAALHPDDTCTLEEELTGAVLARIGLDDAAHLVSVGSDGTWRNGPLAGSGDPTVARYIGAEARAGARAARLAEIGRELEQLAAQDRDRAQRRRQLAADRDILDAELRTAPRTGTLRGARAAVRGADRQWSAAVSEARRLRERARELRQDWQRAAVAHRDACAQFSLPVTVDDLAAVREAAHHAIRSCDRLADELGALAAAVGRYERAVDAAAGDTRQRGDVETTAAEDWACWQREHAEFVALRAAVGQDAAQTMQALRDAQVRHSAVERELKTARSSEVALEGQVSGAARDVEHRSAQARAGLATLATSAGELRRVLQLRGVAEAALADGTTVTLTLPDLAPDAVESAVASVEAALARRARLDESALLRAQQTLERELTGTFDVVPTVDSGVMLFDLVDATGRRTVVEAADELAGKVAEGDAALSDRERTVFTDFVLGGVADELRQQLAGAVRQIKAMNDSLGSIRTSHGIGVKVNWKPSYEPGSALERIRDLLALAGEVRTAEQNAELIALVKARVDAQFAADPNAGYAAHLTEALDYRAWHEVEVVILGPGAGQERRISRRAKLSQGETRFVSYVALFAAADAYLSGLPDTSRALRLILLDDAFAKVDHRTVGVLMGLLVRLDIDFAMTGHALWGTFAQVPSLDVYEVRRRDGSAAVTTHVHWDGHTRHLRAAR